jgi:hypothetical protein
MTFKYPRDALPPKRTPAEEIEFHLLAQDQYRRLRAAYVERRRKDDEAFRAYGHNNNAAPPPQEEGGSTPPPAGD